MKPNLMRTPVINQIYSQKLTYENHIKKLERIRENRKTQLNNDQYRHTQLQHIKDGKSRTFAHRFNQQNSQINHSNIKFLVKLEKVKPFTRCVSHSTYDKSFKDLNNTSIKPVNKMKIIETEKQNSRIFFKMKSVSSSLSKDKMMGDYAKAQQIKTRITKYALENNKISLKSEKYFSQNKSVLSRSSLTNSHTERIKPNLVSHYKASDIIKNRVKSDNRIIKVPKLNQALPALVKQTEFQSKNIQDKTFFTTEPIKSKKNLTERKKRG